ncbi:SdpI family protein [Corynebacterium lizhenjunii]|uniref:SdpI family protein n=1 Tax=Corynebacterium lizhenjunii TaxID=2709394 RepID=UPI0013EC3253|nr:SdpI family protein [Corynebacterium lizhenjunii]
MAVFGVILLVFAAFLLIVGGLAALKRLPGNNVFGLRVEEARASQEAWEVSHAVAGPVWALGGLSLLFGGLVAFIAQGWMWLLPIVSVIVAVLAVSVGANLGARAAYLFHQNQKDAAGGCGENCNCGGHGEAESAPAPAVDLGALRQAAQQADHK